MNEDPTLRIEAMRLAVKICETAVICEPPVNLNCINVAQDIYKFFKGETPNE